MAKCKSKYVCQNCGYESAGYLGKCPECGSWSSFIEEIAGDVQIIHKGLDTTPPTLLSNVEMNTEIRTSTRISEFDRVLGGGIVKGSLILIAGDPGIGKSTILLQTSGKLSENSKKVLYISAEESSGQVRLRAERLGINTNNLYIYPQTNFELIKKYIIEMKPDLVIVDSIQAIYTSEIQSSAGSVSQIRECCNSLMGIAKTEGISIFVIGHVTKEGNIAGPKVLEHMVDVVIQFEGDKYKSYRILRSIKNRFGNTSEVGIFEMCQNGLKEIINPSELFLKEYNQTQTPGSTIIVTNEGTRPLLVEIQALTVPAKASISRIYSEKIDTGRVARIAAVIEKRCGLCFSDQDIYVNVAGGVKLNESSIDAALAAALYSARTDIPLESKTAIFGELSLAGEIRPVSKAKQRVRTANSLGFNCVLSPEGDDNSIKVQTLKELIKETFRK